MHCKGIKNGLEEAFFKSRYLLLWSILRKSYYKVLFFILIILLAP